MSTPKVCISLVTYNGEQYIGACMESILAQDYPSLELRVLDNASHDRTVECVLKIVPDAHIVRSEKNLGFAQGHNVLFRETDARYVLCLNQDAVLAPDYVSLLVQALEHDPRSASASGCLVQGSVLTESAHSARVDTCGIAFRNGHFAYEYGRNMDASRFHSPFEIFGASAAAALYRMAALNDCAIVRKNAAPEYFDEDFFMYKEDVDLAYRLRWRDWRSVCVGSARAAHVRTGKPEARRSNALVNRLSIANSFSVIFKNFSVPLLIAFAPSLLFEVAKIIYVVLFERSSLSAWPIFFRRIPALIPKRAVIAQGRKIKSVDMVRAMRLPKSL